MYRGAMVSLLKKIYVWSTVDAADIDEARYLLCKKYSEVCDSNNTTYLFTLIWVLDDVKYWDLRRRKAPPHSRV